MRETSIAVDELKGKDMAESPLDPVRWVETGCIWK